MIEQTCRDNLIKVSIAYGKAARSRGKPLNIRQVSKRFYGNDAFLDKFRRGDVSMSLKKFDEIIEAFRAQWPEGAKWPLLEVAVIRSPIIALIPEPNILTKNKTRSGPDLIAAGESAKAARDARRTVR